MRSMYKRKGTVLFRATSKPFKAVFAVFAAAVTLLAGTAVPALADDRVDDAELASPVPLTVNANGVDISGKNLVAVELAKYSYAQVKAVTDVYLTGFDVTDTGYATAINNALTAANINTATSADSNVTYDSKNPMAWVVANLLDSTTSPYAGKLRDFLDQLKNNTAISGATGTTLTPVSGSIDKQSADVEPGVYVVLDKTSTGVASIAMMNGTGVYASAFSTETTITWGIVHTLVNTLKKGDTTYTLGEVSYKTVDDSDSSSLKVSPKASSVEDGIIENDGKTAEAAIGKKVTVTMNGTVPNWTGYDEFYYAINTTYTNGLTYDATNDNMVVKVAGQTLTRDTDYKVTTENGKLHIIFAPSGDTSNLAAMKAKYPVGATVEVSYSMFTNMNLTAGTPATVTSEVEYSQNPNNAADHATVTGTSMSVYTGKFTLTKQDTAGNALAGATFTVTEDGKTTPINLVKVSDNEYRKADLTETTGTTSSITSTTSNNGVITLTGVDGKYTVKETASPYGATLLPSFDLTVKVNQTTGASSLSAFTQDENKLATLKNDATGVTVVNARSLMDMPKTGAAWLMVYATMSVLLLAAAAVMLVRRKA